MNPFIEQSIVVRDEIMGAGKSSRMIKEIEEHFRTNPASDRRYIVVVPLRTEVERYTECCPSANFSSPVEGTGVMKDEFRYLVSKGNNVVTTHAVWECLTKQTLNLIRQYDYTIVIDEVLDCLDVRNFKAVTIKEATRLNYIDVDEDTGVVRWIGGEGYEGTEAFMRIKQLTETGRVYSYRDKRTGDVSMLIWQIPSELFDVSNHVIILTYRFYHSKMRVFFDLNEIEYTIEKQDVSIEKEAIRKLLEITEPTPAWVKNSNGSVFSETWWDKQPVRSLKEYARVFKQMLSRNHPQFMADQKKIVWSTPKSVTRLDMNGTKLPGSRNVLCLWKGRTWINKRLRATNAYADKKYLIYLANLFVKPTLMRYLDEKDVHIDQDELALSDLLQAIWRMSIRNSKPVEVFLGSNRMRKLLQKWLDNED